MICPAEDLSAGWSYVALGHIHRAQSVGGHGHVRYSGSIERLRLDERTTRNGVVLVEIGAGGLVGDPETLPIEATPILDVPIDDPADLDRLEREMATIGRRSLARVRLCYESGRDDLDALTRRVRSLFPRCYSLEHVDVSAPTPRPPTRPSTPAARSARPSSTTSPPASGAGTSPRPCSPRPSAYWPTRNRRVGTAHRRGTESHHYRPDRCGPAADRQHTRGPAAPPRHGR